MILLIVFYLTGGGLMDDNAEVWDTIIELGGGKGFARFGVISAASEVLLLTLSYLTYLTSPTSLFLPLSQSLSYCNLTLLLLPIRRTPAVMKTPAGCTTETSCSAMEPPRCTMYL